MKKNIIIYGAVLTVIGIIAYGFMIRNNAETDSLEALVSENIISNTQVIEKIEKKIFEDFIYDVGPRFSPIKKETIDKATAIDDFFDEEQMQRIVNLTSTSVILFIDNKQSDIRATGDSFKLNEAQLKLLQSSNYSTNLIVRVDYQTIGEENGKLIDDYSTPHLTIVPQKQASYLFGKDAIKYYLKENSKEARIGVDPDKLKPAKLFFTVTKKGTIENIHLDSSSNYPVVDKKMIEIISNLPGEWEPAENTKGEKVDQELVVSFGLMGC